MATGNSKLYPNFDISVWTRSCEEEITTPIEGKITGEIPTWLRGSLLRNGPGATKVGSMNFDHLLDSVALLHRFSIYDGKATYQCRFLKSETYKKNQGAQRIVVTEFGTKAVPDPCNTIFRKVASLFRPSEIMTDNALVSLYPFGDQIYAMTEVPIIHRVDPVTLETMERKNLFGSALVCHSAHPHVMPNGDVYNMGQSIVKGRLQYILVKFPYSEKGDMFEKAHIVGVVPPRWTFNPAYMHSFGMTDKYFVIVEQPMAVSFYEILNCYFKDEPWFSALKWYPDEETHIILVNRETGEEEKRYRTDNLFYMHIINTYEQDGMLVVDLCTYKDAKMLDAMYMESLKNMQCNPNYAEWFRSKPNRIEMRLDAPNLTKVEPRLLADLGCELPQINYRLCNGQPYRYFYAISSDIDTENPGALIKVDTESGVTKTWSAPECYASEPVFVQTPDGVEEDDGVLLSALLRSGHEQVVWLVVLDARTMHEVARAEFQTPSPAMASFEEKLYPNCDASVWLRSCEEEVNKPMQGEVRGVIPAWLRGSLLRNGPGSIKVGSMRFDHLFDSSALLHRFSIHDGTVSYQCRFLRSDTFKKNRAANRIVVTEFGTKAVPDPCHTIFDRVSALFKPGESMSDNAMISLYPFGDEIYAFTEGPIIHRIDPVTLDSLERKNLMDCVALVHHTSHPHVMPNGDVFNVGISVVKGRLRHVVVKFPYSEKGDMFERAHIVGSMIPRWTLHPAYMHTFGITENYFVIVEQPLSISLVSMVRHQLSNDPISSSLQWYPKHDTHIVLISRRDGKEVKRYQTDAFFFLHIINTYEQDNRLVVDICVYKDSKVLDAMYVKAIETMQSNADYADWFRGRPKRILLPLDAPNLTKVESEQLAELGCETPRIHYDIHNGKPYRYFYAISSDVDAVNPGAIIKVDLKTRETKTWCETECYPSEPVFVPAPDAKDEDDGVLLSALVFGGERSNAVALLVLDARSLVELGRAEFVTPSPAPKCLHGWFLPERAYVPLCLNYESDT